MKILHVVKLFYPPERGGVEVFARELCDELSKRGCEIRVLCVNNDKKSVVEDTGRFLATRAKPIARLFSLPISIDAINKADSLYKWADIVHFHHPNPMFNLIEVLKGLKKPSVVQWHSDIVRQWYFMPFYKPFQSILIKRAAKIVTTTPNYLEGSPYLKHVRNKCTYIPLGINPERLREDPNKTREIREKYGDKPLIFSLGRLVPYKGFEFLIKAAKDTKANVVIGGKGPLNEELKALIGKYGLEKQVFLEGMIPDEHIASYYKACDIFVLPSVSRNEAFGIVQMEAMHFKKPVISTDIPGNGVSWVNKHNESGIVVPPKSPKLLANAINDLLNNKLLYERLTNGAYARFERNFHIKRSAELYLNLYKEILTFKELVG